MRLTPEHLGIFTGDMFQPLMGHIRALEEDLASAREREKAVVLAAEEAEHIRCLTVVEQRIYSHIGPTGGWLTSPKEMFSDIALHLLRHVEMSTLDTYVAEQTQAVEAAAYRKAAALMDTHIDYPGDREEEICNNIFAYAHNEILALISPSAQSALDSMLIAAMDKGFQAGQKEVMELKAQTAAMLEKVVAQLDYDISCYDENEGAQRIALQISRDKVRALISTDHAAAGTPFPADAKDQSRKE